MSGLSRAREFRWKFKLVDGTSLILGPSYVTKVIDRRGEWEQPRLVYEVNVNGIIRRLWPEDIADVEQIPL
jgi:hypothetical protein